MSNKSKKWAKIAKQEFAALEIEAQQEWADLHHKVASRS